MSAPGDVDLVAELRRLHAGIKADAVTDFPALEAIDDFHCVLTRNVDTLLRLAEDGVRLRKAMEECAAECDRRSAACQEMAIAANAAGTGQGSIYTEMAECHEDAAALIRDKLNAEVRA